MPLPPPPSPDEASRLEAEQRYQTVVGALAEGVVLQDAQGRILASNESARRILGLTEDQLHGRTSMDPAWACIRPDGSPFPGEEHPAMVALRTRLPLDDVPMGVALPGGARRWIRINARPLFHPGEAEPYAVLTSFADLTERLGIEAELRQHTEILDRFFEMAPDLLCMASLEGRFLRLSQAWEALLGYGLADLVGRPFLDFVHPADLEPTLQAMSVLGHGGPVRDFVNRYRHRDGTHLWLEWRSIASGGVIYAAARDITNRHQAEVALRETEARYRGLFDHTSDAIFWVEQDEGGVLRFAGANPAHEAMTGLAGEVMQGHPVADVLPAEAAVRTCAQYRACLEGGVQVRYEEGRNTPEGLRSWETQLVPIPDGEGRIRRLVGISRDLTERKRMEAALQATAAFQRTLLDSAGSSIIATDSEGLILSLNPAAERLLGYRAEELVGKETPAVIHDPEEVAARALSLSSELGRPIAPGFEVFVAKSRLGQPETREWTYRRKDGTRFPVTLTVTAIGDPGHPTGFMGIASDISALQAAQEELRLMAEVARRTDNGVVLSDAEGRVQWVNEGFTRITGYTLEEVRGKKPGPLLQGPDTDPAAVGRMHAALQRREGFREELLNVAKDGRRYWVALEAHPLTDARGRVTGYMALQSDITLRRESEQHKDDFISVVSHELRTPLTAIRGSLGLLVGGAAGALAGPQLDMLRIAYQNVDRLGRLVNDILDLQKIEAGRMAFDVQVHDLGLLVEGAVEATRPFAVSRGVGLRIEAGVEPVLALVDGDRFQQVVVNLLGNAIKFSPGGEEVVLRLGRDGPWARLEVEDHGPGIPEAFKARIFQKFAQADASTTRASGGTGLGLSIVKTLLDKMGGEAGFQSRPGCTIFHATLPTLPDLP